MTRFMLMLSALAALAATAAEPARAEPFAHADRWMAKRFQRALPPAERRRVKAQESKDQAPVAHHERRVRGHTEVSPRSLGRGRYRGSDQPYRRAAARMSRAIAKPDPTANSRGVPAAIKTTRITAPARAAEA